MCCCSLFPAAYCALPLDGAGVHRSTDSSGSDRDPSSQTTELVTSGYRTKSVNISRVYATVTLSDQLLAGSYLAATWLPFPCTPSQTNPVHPPPCLT
ncbi:hypothetical protein CRENBAI_013412 [Crenichthys baileyi]|uniref:Secreted protein n=1 Tax=Crenichthys baileyi TaxID=28760 RepID=A0AAV9RM28_9TELE